MIYVSQSYPDKGSVIIKVEGSINDETLPVFQDVYNKHVSADKRIAIDLKRIVGVGKQAKTFLKSIHSTVRFIDMPEYLKMEMGI